MRISDWSSDVCSSDLLDCLYAATEVNEWAWWAAVASFSPREKVPEGRMREGAKPAGASRRKKLPFDDEAKTFIRNLRRNATDAEHLVWSYRSEEHTSELQSLMRISYAVFCLKKKKKKERTHS